MIGHTVEFRVGPGLIQGRFRRIDRDNLGRSPIHEAVQAEATGIAADIEHSSIADKVRSPASIVPLIEKEPGLLPLGDIDAVTNAMLFNEHWPGRRFTPEESVGQFQSLGGANPFLGP